MIYLKLYQIFIFFVFFNYYLIKRNNKPSLQRCIINQNYEFITLLITFIIFSFHITNYSNQFPKAITYSFQVTSYFILFESVVASPNLLNVLSQLGSLFPQKYSSSICFRYSSYPIIYLKYVMLLGEIYQCLMTDSHHSLQWSYWLQIPQDHHPSLTIRHSGLGHQSLVFCHRVFLHFPPIIFNYYFNQ